jgi:D-proline reductase (dithiol) PrdB
VQETQLELTRLLNLKQTKDKLLARLFTRFPILLTRWAQKAKVVTFDDSPWTPLKKRITDCRVALVTTGGVHMADQQPFDMRDSCGDPTYRKIRSDVSCDDLTITHDYYDHTDADQDVNIVLPIEILRLLERFNEIGSIGRHHFSFMGHIARHQLDVLHRETAPKAAAAMVADDIDLAILTPA